MVNDEQTVRSILLGDEEKFSILIDKYYPKLKTFCIKLFMPMEDVEDIIQEIFLKVYKNLYKYSFSWSFNTWIYKIAVNTLKDIKKRKVIHTSNIEIENFAQSNDFQNSCVDKLYNREIIRAMFNSMDEKLKTMMILRYYEDMPFKEIGQVFNMTPGAVKMKIFRARGRLCKEYSEDYLGGRTDEMHV
jgi:RNA polymerase sigma-70 factor (ECF subfamily)